MFFLTTFGCLINPLYQLYEKNMRLAKICGQIWVLAERTWNLKKNMKNKLVYFIIQKKKEKHKKKYFSYKNNSFIQCV